MRRIIVACLVVAALAGSPGFASAAGGVKPGPERVAPLPEAEREAQRAAFRQGMIIGGGELIRWAMDEYADEFRQLEDRLITGVHNGDISIAEAATQTYAFSVMLRGRAMAYIEKAPDVDIHTMLVAQLDLLRDFQKMNFRACYEFGEQGGLSEETVANIGEEGRLRMSQYTSAMLKAVLSGKAAPVQRVRLSQADIDLIITEYLRLDGSQAWLAASGSGDYAGVMPEERCAGAIVLLQAVLNQPLPVGGRFAVSH